MQRVFWARRNTRPARSRRQGLVSRFSAFCHKIGSSGVVKLLHIMKPLLGGFLMWGRCGTWTHDTRFQSGVLRNASGISQGNLLLKTCFQRSNCGLAESESSPTRPSNKNASACLGVFHCIRGITLRIPRLCSMVHLVGVEPTAFGTGNQRSIHWATGALLYSTLLDIKIFDNFFV